MAVVESLVKGKDSVVRGANLRVIAKGKPVRISRPVQKLYPIEVKSTIQGNNQIGSTRRVKEQVRRLILRRGSHRYFKRK